MRGNKENRNKGECSKGAEITKNRIEDNTNEKDDDEEIEQRTNYEQEAKEKCEMNERK